MNKKIIKNMFDEKINSDDIYKKVIEQSKNNKKNYILNTLKISILPMCIVFIMFLSLNNNLANNKENTNTNNKVLNIININDLYTDINDNNRYAYSKQLYDYDILGRCIDLSKNEIISKFFWLKNIIIPKYLKSGRIMELYAYEKENDTIQGYNLIYSTEDSEKIVDIYFSSIRANRLRCVSIPKIDFKDSIINGVNVKIIKSGNKYYAFFNSRELNFDIEVKNISEQELITLIESIIE